MHPVKELQKLFCHWLQACTTHAHDEVRCRRNINFCDACIAIGLRNIYCVPHLINILPNDRCWIRRRGPVRLTEVRCPWRCWRSQDTSCWRDISMLGLELTFMFRQVEHEDMCPYTWVIRAAKMWRNATLLREISKSMQICSGRRYTNECSKTSANFVQVHLNKSTLAKWHYFSVLVNSYIMKHQVLYVGGRRRTSKKELTPNDIIIYWAINDNII